MNVIEFGIDLISGTAQSIARPVFPFSVRIAPLDHKARNHPMEFDAVIELLAGEPLKVFHRSGRLIREELEYNLALIGGDHRDFFTNLRCVRVVLLWRGGGSA